MSTPDNIFLCDCNNLDEVLTADFYWAIFAAAVSSYKLDSLLRPFPPRYLNENGDKDMETLRSVVLTLPSVMKISNETSLVRNDQIELMEWLTNATKIRLQRVNLAELKSLQSKTNEQVSIPEPQHLFRIIHCDDSESCFQKIRANRTTLYAYHGSKVENFYSILNHGLHGHMNKTSLFGEGTYLSIEPSVALGFSPWGSTGWKNSNIGDLLSIVALCEIIEDSNSVKMSTKEGFNRRGPNSIAGDLPDKYILVTNNELIRVRYLLVYSKASSHAPSARPSNKPGQTNRVVEFFIKHGSLCMMLFYAFLLIAIGLAGSKTFWIKVKRFYEAIFENLDNWKHYSNFS